MLLVVWPLGCISVKWSADVPRLASITPFCASQFETISPNAVAGRRSALAQPAWAEEPTGYGRNSRGTNAHAPGYDGLTATKRKQWPSFRVPFYTGRAGRWVNPWRPGRTCACNRKGCRPEFEACSSGFNCPQVMAHDGTRWHTTSYGIESGAFESRGVPSP